MLISGKCYKTIYFHSEITVIKRIHLTKCDDEKKSNCRPVLSLYMDQSLAKISWMKGSSKYLGSTKNDVTLLPSLKWRDKSLQRSNENETQLLRLFVWVQSKMTSHQIPLRLLPPLEWRDKRSQRRSNEKLWVDETQLLRCSGQIFWRIWFPSTFHFEVLGKSKIPCCWCRDVSGNCPQ